jgi:hypothetical protein
MSSKPVVIKLYCDSKETQTKHVRSKLSEILNHITIIKISDHSNIGSDYRYLKLIIRLTISIIDYRLSIIDYRTALA